MAEHIYLGDLPIGVAFGSGSAMRVHADYLGTPRAITNGSTLVWKWDSTDPFGANLPSVQSVVYNPRFPGHLIYGFDVEAAADEKGASRELHDFDHDKLVIPFQNPHPPGSYDHAMAVMTNKGPERLARAQANGDDFYLGVNIQSLPATISVSELLAATQNPEALAARDRFEHWWTTSEEAMELREATGIDEDVPRDFYAFDETD